MTFESSPGTGVLQVRRWWNGRTRMVAFVFGGLLVLQSSDTLDLAKLSYLVLVGATIVSAIAATWRQRDSRDFSGIGPWLAISVAFAGVVAVSLPVALAHGTGLVPWLRGAAPYGLFAAAPLIALDARRVVSAREAVGWMMTAAGLAAISFSVYWLERRQIVDLAIDRMVLPSAQLAFAGFAVACAFAFRSRWVVPWAVAAGSILGLLLITGTRTTLLIIAIPAILAVVGRPGWRQAVTAVTVGAATAVIVVVLTVGALSSQIQAIGPTPSSSPAANEAHEAPRPGLIGERLGSVGTLVGESGSGQSLTERIAQTQAALSVFVANPLLGIGPGALYTWTNSSGLTVESSTLDTPLMVAAEFGMLGILACLAFIAVFIWFIGFNGRRIGRSAEQLSVVGLAATFGLTGILGPPMDDKGAAYALALVLVIALSARPTAGRAGA